MAHPVSVSPRESLALTCRSSARLTILTQCGCSRRANICILFLHMLIWPYQLEDDNRMEVSNCLLDAFRRLFC